MKESPLRLLVLTDGGWDHASSRIRGVQYQPLLETAGYRVRWIPRVPERGEGVLRRGAFALGKRARWVQRVALLSLGWWDLVYVQRTFLPRWVLAYLRRRGIPLVYDFDDALYLRAPDQTAAMVEAASEVVVSSPELVAFCEAHGAVPTVIPTPVDVDRIRPGEGGQEGEGPLVVGWIGSPWTAPYLQTIAPALAEAAARRPLRLLAVGAGAEGVAAPGLPVEVEQWSFEREPEHLARMTVGVMPLPDTPWAQGKGGYKLLLYMAAGLPVVASPVGINREIVREGVNGFLAADAAAWVEALVRLHDDPALRRAMGAAGRALAEEHYSRRACFASLRAVLDRAACTPSGTSTVFPALL